MKYIFKNFFEDEFSKALNEKRLCIKKPSKEYVVSVFCDFIKSDNILNLTQDKTSFPVLFSFYEKAQKSFNAFNDYRELGDVSLFVSGMFCEYISRRHSLVSKDYFINMGRSGYLMASKLTKIKDFNNLFYDLSVNFDKVVGAINSLSNNLKNERYIKYE